MLTRAGNPTPCTFRYNSNNVGIYQNISNVPAGWYVIEATVEKPFSNWQGAGIHCNFNNGSSISLSFASYADINGLVYGGSDYTKRTWSVLVNSQSQSSDVSFYDMGGWSGFGLDGSSADFLWHQCSLRPATDGEIKGQAANSAVGSLTARVTTTEGAIATAQGKLSSYWQTTAVAGNGRAQLTLHADANGGGGVDIVGDVAISGNLVVDGTIQSTKVATSAIQQTVFQMLQNTITISG